jgi:hypothetical protein
LGPSTHDSTESIQLKNTVSSWTQRGKIRGERENPIEREPRETHTLVHYGTRRKEKVIDPSPQNSIEFNSIKHCSRLMALMNGECPAIDRN